MDAPSLTPTDVLTLRASVRWRLNVTLPPDVPHIAWDGVDRVWNLYAYGHIQARSADPGVLLACCIAERAEAGFIRRILDTATDPETACLDPDERRQRQSAINAAAATVKANAATDAASRRLQALRPSSVTLSDLFED